MRLIRVHFTTHTMKFIPLASMRFELRLPPTLRGICNAQRSKGLILWEFELMLPVEMSCSARVVARYKFNSVGIGVGLESDLSTYSLVLYALNFC